MPRQAQRTERVRLIIVDDSELVVAGLRAMLSDVPDLDVIAEGHSGREAVELCQRLQPELAIIDLRMPDLDGIAATAEIM